MREYLSLMQRILETGDSHDDRTGVGTTCLFGASLTIDLCDGLCFPLLGTKRMSLRTVFYELMWFLSGSDKIEDLRKHGVTIWDGNYNSETWQQSPYFVEGSVGRNYGVQWRKWSDGTIHKDQIATLLQSLTNDPQSRRHLVTAWNPLETHKTALPPCHVLFQIKIHADESMSMVVYQRSADYCLGIPVNIASYSLLLLMLARITGRAARNFTLFMGDVHIYNNHLEGARLQLTRTPYPMPQLLISTRKVETPTVQDLLSFTIDDLALVNYHHHPTIRFPMAV